MPHIYRSVVVPYSVEQMYALVNDVGAYPTFVPGCTESIVHEQSENEMRVTLTFSVKGILQSFTTVNKLQPHQLIEMRLAQGFFKQLNGFFRLKMMRQENLILYLTYRLNYLIQFFQSCMVHCFNVFPNVS